MTARKKISAFSLPEDALGERVALLRNQKGLTHDGLSNLSKVADIEGKGISRTTIRGYELGTYKPGARELRVLSAALEVSPAWLLTGDDSALPSVRSQTIESKRKGRWADWVMFAVEMMHLNEADCSNVMGITESIARVQIGEVRFRKLRAFVDDFIDLLQDTIADRKEHGELSVADYQAVFHASVADIRKRYGDEEAALYLAFLDPLYRFWEKEGR